MFYNLAFIAESDNGYEFYVCDKVLYVIRDQN